MEASRALNESRKSQVKKNTSPLWYPPKRRRKPKRKATISISPEDIGAVAGQQNAAGETAPPIAGGVNGGCKLVSTFATDSSSLAVFLTMGEASRLRQLCKAFYHGGQDPVSFVCSVALHATARTSAELARLGTGIRVLSLYGHQPSAARLEYLASRLAPSVEVLDCDVGHRCNGVFFNLFAARCQRLRELHAQHMHGELFTAIRQSKWPDLRRLTVEHVSDRGWVELMCALCASWPLHLELLDLHPAGHSSSITSLHQLPPWAPGLRTALLEGRFSQIERVVVALPRACSSGMDPKDVVREGFASPGALAEVREVSVWHPWDPEACVRLPGDRDGWGPEWRGMWAALDAARLESIEVRDEHAVVWSALQEEMCQRPFPRLRSLSVAVYCSAPAPSSGLDGLLEALEMGHLPGLESIELKGELHSGNWNRLFSLNFTEAAIARLLSGPIQKLDLQGVFHPAYANNVLRIAGECHTLKELRLSMGEPHQDQAEEAAVSMDMRSLMDLDALHLGPFPLTHAAMLQLCRQLHELKEEGEEVQLKDLQLVVELPGGEEAVMLAKMQLLVDTLAVGCLPHLERLKLVVFRFWQTSWSRECYSRYTFDSRLERRLQEARRQNKRRDGVERDWTVEVTENRWGLVY